ncbi:MAG: hypothetical protein C0626_12810 [Arcobacter sp.]|uniref:hypothetical protein n=1 Tax=uncultured Arcobacter sp. TaxID=165434 RepID=UPI000CC37C8D|nr:hypothetical protein [uncultured Arcobacter sp.]PLY08722.1 MAG: hypothetical protein C0626_12810 [Arcobacter sp.]
MKNIQIIATLTTHSTRIKTVHLAIETILGQTVKADKVILWLTKGEYLESEIPNELKLLQKKGLEIEYCDDIKVFQKLIPTLKKFPNDLIITFDDDIFYKNTIIEELLDAYEKEPNIIHCMRGHKIKYTENGELESYNKWDYCTNDFQAGFDIFPTGVGGVLYFPGCFYEDVLKSDFFLSLTPNNDDVWLKAMSLKKDVKCKIVKQENNKYMNLDFIDGTQEIGLCTINIDEETGNNLQIKNVFTKYNIYNKKLINKR